VSAAAPLLHATLGPQDRAELLRDLSAVAEVFAVQLEDEQGTRACRLDEAFAALEQGSARRALVRYRFEGRTWLDTLLPDGGGGDLVRLVRVAEDDLQPDEASGA